MPVLYGTNIQLSATDIIYCTITRSYIQGISGDLLIEPSWGKSGVSMDIIFTAFLAEVTSRSLSFSIGKCMEEGSTTSKDEMLQRLLLRVRVIVEEADERSTTNQAMIQQLNMLRKEMYRGYYVLDSFGGKQSKNDQAEHHNCMFGRQMEMERIINFLMQIEPFTGESIGILPIIGSAGVGKSTLVAHVYNTQQVRNHFSRIVIFTQDDLKDSRLTSLEGGVTIHQNNPMHFGKGRFLIIVELSQDVDEATWKRLYVASSGCLESDSKIIVTSRSNNIMNFGSTQALILNILPIEAYWYVFLQGEDIQEHESRTPREIGVDCPRDSERVEWIVRTCKPHIKLAEK